jgi:hypothetical protein
VIGDEGIEAVIVALGSVNRLGATDFLRRFAEVGQLSIEIRLLHRCLRCEDRGQSRGAEHGMGIRVTGCPGVQSLTGCRIWHDLLSISRNGIVLGIGTHSRPAEADKMPRLTDTRAMPARHTPRFDD